MGRRRKWGPWSGKESARGARQTREGLVEQAGMVGAGVRTQKCSTSRRFASSVTRYAISSSGVGHGGKKLQSLDRFSVELGMN